MLKGVVVDGRSQWKATGITIGFVSNGIMDDGRSGPGGKWVVTSREDATELMSR